MMMIAMMALSEDERGFIEDLIVKYGAKMYSKAKYILKNDHDAEDAVQATFEKIIKHIDKFDGDDIEHKEMLARIEFGLMASIENTSKTHYKRRGIRIKKETELYVEVGEEHHIIEPADDSESVEDMIITAEEYELVRKALVELSQDLQAAVYFVYSKDFSYAEAAEYLGISLSALKDRIYRAKKKIREIVEGDFCEQSDK